MVGLLPGMRLPHFCLEERLEERELVGLLKGWESLYEIGCHQLRKKKQLTSIQTKGFI